ncbi:MAG: hypothetical protein R3324_21540, partial [Halobacteriales archaeon]|nr:hypothetical protein [Halobacteriales archaeon]
MPLCLFAADLHGRPGRYETLVRAIRERRPDGVFLGGDLLPMPLAALDPRQKLPENFTRDFLTPRFDALRNLLGPGYPDIFLILGND